MFSIRNDPQLTRADMKYVQKLDKLLGDRACEIDDDKIVFVEHPDSAFLYKMQRQFPEFSLLYQSGDMVLPCCHVVLT